MLARALEHDGFEIVGPWFDEEVGYDVVTPEHLARAAVFDARGVSDCDVLIQLALPGSRGGMFAELGMALAYGKRVVVYGQRTSLFHHHPAVTVFPMPESRQALAQVGSQIRSLA